MPAWSVGKKPYIAPAGTAIEPVELEARRVVLSAAHLQRYREVCSVPATALSLPPAYLHLVAMPMHMQLFVVRNFPVKVLGLIHLRNTIRVLHPVELRAPLRLTVHFDTMRLTDFGQEYDFVTRYEQNGAVVWEEVSTMFARGNTAPKEGSQACRASSAHTLPASGCVDRNARGRRTTQAGAMRASPATSIRFISPRGPRRCSASSRPWRTACGRSAGASHRARRICPSGKMQVDTQFKLPVYIPSQALARTWNSGDDASRSRCARLRGDRLHLAMQVRAI